MAACPGQVIDIFQREVTDDKGDDLVWQALKAWIWATTLAGITTAQLSWPVLGVIDPQGCQWEAFDFLAVMVDG
jgi:hypothetical protein